MTETRRKPILLNVLLAAILLLAAYVLCFGPVMRGVADGRLSPDAIVVRACKPLFLWLYLGQPWNVPLRWYCGLWIEDFEMIPFEPMPVVM
jgi:hypothetical protein